LDLLNLEVLPLNRHVSHASPHDYFIVSEFTAYHKCYIDMQFVSSVTLLSPGSSDGEFAFSSLWDAEKEFAVGAKADTGWVGEDGVDVLALWALDIHEEGLWGLYELLKLVLALFFGWVNVKYR